MEQTRVIHSSPPAVWIPKLVARGLAFIFCLTIIGLGGSLASTIIGIIPFACLAFQSILGFCWNLAEGICLLVRDGNRGIHPGANVALDLILWLGFLFGSVGLGMLGYATTAGLAVAIGAGSSITDDYGDDDYWDFNYSKRSSGAELQTRDSFDSVTDFIGKCKGLLALGILLVLLHFGLFVVACYETHQRNMARKVVVAPGGAVAVTGIQMQPAPVTVIPAPVASPAPAMQHPGMGQPDYKPPYYSQH